MKITDIITEAANSAQQAAKAIAMKKAGKKPKQGVTEGYQLDEGAIETITALAKKIPGIGKYYQMAQQYKPQLIEILKTSKSGKEVKQKMEQLVAQQSATVAESGMMKQLGGLAVGGGSILSTMWMNAMGMIDGVLAHAAAGEVGGAVASGSILGLIPVTLMLFAAMLMFKGSKQSSDEKAQAFQAQRGQQGVAEGLNTGPQIIYATGPRTQGINDVDLVFKDLRTGKIVAHVVGNNNSLQEFALPDGGGDGGNPPERPATYEIRMNNSKAPTYVAVGDPNQDSEHKVYKLGPKQPGAQAYYGMGITLVSKLDWWSFLEKMLGEIMAEDDAIESGLVDRKGDGDLVFVKQQGVAEGTELAEEFDLIESIVEMIAEHNGVDADVVWADLESLTEDELYVFAVTSNPLMESEAWQKANKRDKTDGMSQKAVNTYRREHPGSKLKTAVTTKPSKLKKGSKASKRRKSYCSRSRGQMKMHSISCAKTPDKAICKARRRWNC